MPRIIKDLTQEKIKEILEYDPETGIFRWKINTHPTRYTIGKVAGSKRKNKIKEIGYNGHHYTATRLAWIYMHGSIKKDMVINCIDGNSTNIRMNNLEEISNSKLWVKKQKGVNITRKMRKGKYEYYIVRIKVDDRKVNTSFKNREDAEEFVKKFKEKYC